MVKSELAWEYGQRDANPYRVEWQLLLDAIRQNKAHNEARRAGEAEIAALMGRIAAHTGQLVTWDQVVNSDFQFVDDIDNMSFDTPAPIQTAPGTFYLAPQPGITQEC